MIHLAGSYSRWLADYYLLATILLALSLIGTAMLKQPAQRLAIAKSTLVSLVLLAVLCAIPGWSIVHLLTESQPQRVAEFRGEVSAQPVVRAERVPPTILDKSAVVREEGAVPLTKNSQPEPAADIHLSWLALLATTHLAGAAGIILWLLLGWLASARLRRTARPAPPELLAILNELFKETHSSVRRPRLLTHDRIEVAVALGAWRPTILLPARWLAQIPLPFREGLGEGSRSENLRTVLAHESTHILNHDLRWIALTRILFIALWANPFFWTMKRRLRLDQEALADAAAAELTSRQHYAEQLVAWARDISTRPSLHLSSAVGLWEGPSQLRQRIAILLNDRLIVWRDCSRKWRLTAVGLSTLAAFMLSLVTLQPAQSQEKRPVKAAAPSPESPISTQPVKLGDRFILCPVTTELQRSLLGDVDQPLSKASLCVFVNFAELKEDPIEASSPFFAGLAEKLSAFAKTNNELVMFRVYLGTPRQAPFDTVHKHSESLSKLCETIGKDSGFKRVRTSQTFFSSDFDWSKYVADVESIVERTKKSPISPGEKSLGNDHLRVFAVSTFLSRMLAQDTDCVVNINPIVRPHDGSRFPADFTTSMQEFIPKLKYGRNKTMLIRVRFAESEKETLSKWVNNNDGRRTFARQFGFEYCNLQQSQVAAEDVAKLEKDEAANRGTAAPKPAGNGKAPAAPEKDRAQPGDANALSAEEENNKSTAGVFVTSTFTPQPGTPNSIEGQCVDENGKPLANVNIILARVWYQDAARREIVAKQTTKADGRFRFDNVVDIARIYPNGKIPKLPDLAGPYYQVSARAASRVSQSAVNPQNNIALRGWTMNIKMPPAATLRGRITGPKGEPVAGALVSIGFSQLDRWQGFQTVRSGPDGRYEIDDAPPFDSKNVKTGTFGAGKQDELVFPRVINVKHPNYASRAVLCEKIPGTQDVQLKAAAIIKGRVIDGATKQPLADAGVQAFPSRQNSTLWDVATSFAFVRTDARGEYRITSLPEGTYDLWAVAPNRVNEGVKNLKTSAEHVTTAPDLVMTGGGTIRVRLIDDKTRQPVPIKGDERAHINVTPSPPLTAPATVDVNNGRFEVHALPGEDRIDEVYASSNDAMKWIIRPGEKVPAHVVEGKSTDVDVRVQDIANMERWNKIGALLSRAQDERDTDERKAITDFEEVIKLDPPYPHNVIAHACLASILATSADDSIRDGKRAVELAQKAQQLEDKPSAFVLEALAAAYAEVGDFDRAVASEKQAIELAKKEQKGNPPTDDLKLYEAHKPRREPPKRTGSKNE